MTASSNASTDLLGYLTFVEIPNLGIVGGYLIVDRRARPVEFHCTAPVQPNRTQEILFGSSLRCTLYCDQIGRALLNQSSTDPSLLVTDEVQATELRSMASTALALLASDLPPRNVGESLKIGGYAFTTAPGFEADQRQIRELLAGVAEGGWDLAEPLGRIRAAVHEAQRAAA